MIFCSNRLCATDLSVRAQTIVFKEIHTSPKNKKKLKMYPRFIIDVDEFVSSSEQIWRNVMYALQ